jgi:hypothetical protein
VYVSVWREEVVHDHKMYLSPIGYLDSVQAIKLREQGVGVVLHMFVVIFQDSSQEFVLGMVDGLDDVLIVPRKVEKTTTLAR